MFAPPSAIGKNMIFWRKIVFFHTKHLKIFRASLRSSHFFKCAPPNLKSWIRPCIKIVYAVSKYNHIFICLRQTITWFISRVNISYQDVTFNKHTSKGHSILLNNTSRRINCVSTFKKYIHFYLVLFVYILIVNLIKLATFIPKYRIIFYITKGRVT